MQHLNHLKIYYFFNNKVWKIITNHALKRRVVLHTTFSPLKKLFFHLLVKLLARKSVSGVVFILIIECLPRNGSITIDQSHKAIKVFWGKRYFDQYFGIKAICFNTILLPLSVPQGWVSAATFFKIKRRHLGNLNLKRSRLVGYLFKRVLAYSLIYFEQDIISRISLFL